MQTGYVALESHSKTMCGSPQKSLPTPVYNTRVIYQQLNVDPR